MFTSRSELRLRSVHPKLADVVRRAKRYADLDFQVLEGLRSPERQQALYRRGASRTLKSKHLKQVDGYSHAVDLVLCGDLDGDGDVDAYDRKLVWDRDGYRRLAAVMKECAIDLGVAIRWGGDFQGFFDGPHFELLKGFLACDTTTGNS